MQRRRGFAAGVGTFDLQQMAGFGHGLVFVVTLAGECESVHLARWPERAADGTSRASFAGAGSESATDDWSLLLRLRDAVNAAIEPLRAARTLATTIFAGNEPSIRLFHSLGFQEWGRLPGVADLDGVIHDVVLVGRRVDDVSD